MNRLFLMFAFSAMAFSACSGSGDDSSNSSSGNTTEPDVTGEVRVLTTTSTRSRDLASSTLPLTLQQGMQTSNTITLLPNETYQTMDGFGVAITGSTCYNLMQMTPENRKLFLTETFSEQSGYGFSYCRVSIGCSDFSLSEFTCCDTPGIENFALTEEDTQYVIPILKEILAIQPTLKIMGTPWTPPRWMKVNDLKNKKPYNSWTSGQLNPDYYQDYATYFVKWIQAFEAQGIKIYSVTPQNEPLNRGNSASCFMPWDQERDFVKTALGPAFQQAGIQTKIYAFDHNYNYDNMSDQRSYPTKIYGDVEAAQYLAGAAFHNYGGDKDELTLVHNATPAKDLVFSETSIGTWNDGQNLSVRLMDDMQEVALGTINRWCKGVIVWNLMLDAKRGPNRPGGCQTCFGAVDINTDYATITRNSHYYIIAHLSSVVKPDAVRIGTSGYTTPGLTYTAFRNTDGSYALVMSNNSSSTLNVIISDGSKQFEATVYGMSAVSYLWK